MWQPSVKVSCDTASGGLAILVTRNTTYIISSSGGNFVIITLKEHNEVTYTKDGLTAIFTMSSGENLWALIPFNGNWILE